MVHIHRRARWQVLPLLTVVSLLLAACGGDSTSDGTASKDNSASPDSKDPDAAVSGTYAPQPLSERGKVTISVAAKLEFAAPLLLAQEYGEFEKENLDVEIIVTGDSIAALNTGQVDAAYTAPSAGVINAMDAGLEQKWVAGNYTPTAGSKSGLWAAKEIVGSSGDLAELKGAKVSKPENPGGVITYFVDRLLEDTSVSIDEMNFQFLGAADNLSALENGAVDAAWLLDPIQNEVIDNPDMVFLGGQPEGEVGGGTLFGPPLLDPDNRDVGLALLRAMRRTVETYLQAGYKDDPEIVSILADLGEMPEERVTASEELVFEFSIAEGLATRMQETWIKVDAMQADKPLPEEEVVDRSFIEEIESA